MKRTVFFVLLLLLAMLSLPHSGLATEAADITRECRITSPAGKKEVAKMLDAKYKTYFRSGTNARALVEVFAPEDTAIGCISLKWYERVLPFRVISYGEMGVTGDQVIDNGFFAAYVPMPPDTTSLKIMAADGVKGRLFISDIRVYSTGEPPLEVQRWDPPCDRADLLVIAAHPDDELLFMGGTLPTYAGEQGYRVQVAYAVPALPIRRLELLDGLWMCGVRNYPHMGHFRDTFTSTLKQAQKSWGKDKVDRFVAELYRCYRPFVVVTHDVNGEYGHGAHRILADAAQTAVLLAADRAFISPEGHEPWEIDKLYLHLYPEGMLQMDWHVPLMAFDGKTALEVAEDAFALHTSQKQSRYKVEGGGPNDNSLFGLAYTKVGPDDMGGDFFEHISELVHWGED